MANDRLDALVMSDSETHPSYDESRSLPSSLIGRTYAWVPGLLIAFVCGIEIVAAPPDEAHRYRLHWVEYFLVGFAFPITLAALAFAGMRKQLLIRILRGVFTAFLALWCLNVMYATGRYYVIAFSFLTAIALYSLKAFRQLGRPRQLESLLFVLLGWTVMMTQGVEYNAIPALTTLRVNTTTLLFAALGFLTITVVARERAAVSQGNGLARKGIYVLATLAAFELAFRLERFILPHNWGYFVGPATLIREGGWLLYDVPSQYGFLNVLAIALWPNVPAWDAMRLVIASLVAAQTLVLFALFYTKRTGALSLIFAIAVAIAFGEFESGSRTGDSFFAYPASGPFRFFPLYVVLFALVRTYLTTNRGTHRTWSMIGTGAWLLACLWSAESAIYATCCWIPASMFEAVVGAGDNMPLTIVRGVSRAGISLAKSIGCIGILVAAVSIIYLFGLHRLPDWWAFIEFGFLYAGGIVAYPADPYGSIWLMAALLAMLAGVGLACARARRWNAVPVVLGTWGAVWAQCSYFMARSVNNNVNAFLTLTAIAIGVVLLVLDRERFPGRPTVLRFLIIPIITWGMLLTFGNIPQLKEVALPGMRGHSFSVGRYIKRVDSDLEQLLKSVQITDESPLVSLALKWDAIHFSDGTTIAGKSWLPIDSSSLFAQLPLSRRAQYIERYRATHRADGWIISRSTGSFAGLETCTDFGAIPQRRAQRGEWIVSFCSAPVSSPLIRTPQTVRDLQGVTVGSVDEVYLDGAVTYEGSTRHLLVKRGQVVNARGWLVRLDAAPLRGRLMAAVDETKLTTAEYGTMRLDVPERMKSIHGGHYSDSAGFEVAVRTQALAAGPHMLTFILVDAGARRELSPRFPFVVY